MLPGHNIATVVGSKGLPAVDFMQCLSCASESLLPVWVRRFGEGKGKAMAVHCQWAPLGQFMGRVGQDLRETIAVRSIQPQPCCNFVTLVSSRRRPRSQQHQLLSGNGPEVSDIHPSSCWQQTICLTLSLNCGSRQLAAVAGLRNTALRPEVPNGLVEGVCTVKLVRSEVAW